MHRETAGPTIQVIHASGFPPLAHPAEADVFARHEGVPGHDQQRLADARVLIVGAGGLGSWTATALARSGVRNLTIADKDQFERSNASRQLMFCDDLGRSKAFAVAANVASHMVGGGVVTALHLSFAEAAERYALTADVIAVLVDNNSCRLEAVKYARARGIPAVFSMLSHDSMRVHTFLQGPDEDDPCLWCAVPDLDPSSDAPCASATIASCLISAAQATFFVYRALMGWPSETKFNWRASDLMGFLPEQVGTVRRRDDCRACGAAR